MATGINPYSGGAVVFNQQPWLSFYERQMMRQQARMNALDDYFRDLNKNVTPAGMRQQDVQQLLEKNRDWQSKYMENKAAILNPRKDGGRSYNDYMTGYQDQLALIQQSKDAMKQMDEIGKMKLNPKMSYVFEDPHVMDQIAAHELPIGHPDRKPIDLATFSMPERPIDSKEMESFQKYVTGGLKPDTIPGRPINVGDYQTQTPIIHQHSDDNIKVMGDRASDLYDTDRRWRLQGKKVMDQMLNDPTTHEQLNSTFKNIYGRDIDDAKDALMAKTMVDNKTKSVDYKPGQDIYGRELAMAGVKHNYRLNEIDAAAKMRNKSSDYQDKVIGNLYENLKTEALKPENKREYDSADGKVEVQHDIKAAGAIQKMFAVPDAKGHLIYPDAIRYSGDKKTVIPVFLRYYPSDYEDSKLAGKPIRGKTGKAVVDKELSKPIMEEEFKERYKKQLMGTSAYDKTILSKGGTDEGGDDNENDPLGLGF